MVVCQDEMDTYYLDNLDEYINDEGRIVTYKWLSLTLGVHSNVAKQMLHHFATLQRSNGGGADLTLTYMVSGVVEESGSDGRLQKVVKVVREREVEAARASMKAVSSIHVYSVQKSALPDVGVLYGANYDVMKQHLSNISRYSGIRCSEAQVSPSTGRLQQVVEEVTLPIQKKVPKIDEKEENKKTNPKLDNTTKSTTTSKHTNQIASMFAQQSKKQEGPQKTVAKEEKAPAKSKGAGISAFFTKGTVQRKPDTTSKSDTPASGLESDSSPCPAKSKESLVAEDPQQNPKGTEDSKELEIVQEKKLHIKEEEEEKTKSGGCAKKMKTNKVTSSQKKRKSKGLKSEPKIKRSRIMQLSDSDSDESAKEEDREEDEYNRLLLLPSPPPPVRVNSDSEEEREGEKSLHPSTSLKEEVKPGMRKKMVDNTFINEEGYFVTNKVYKLVELTEEEIKQEEEEKKDEEEKIKKKEEERKIKEEEERKKEKSSPPMKRDYSPSSSSPQKKKRGGKKEDNKKQSKIMSFFTKK